MMMRSGSNQKFDLQSHYIAAQLCMFNPFTWWNFPSLSIGGIHFVLKEGGLKIPLILRRREILYEQRREIKY